MLKLYKFAEPENTYWETWDISETKGIIHWGALGETGKQKEIKSKSGKDLERTIQKEVIKKINQGYTEVDIDQLIVLEVRCEISKISADQAEDKLADLDDYLGELLGWRGLGHVEEAISESGEICVSCMVVNYEIAKDLIENDLKTTDFKDNFSIRRGS